MSTQAAPLSVLVRPGHAEQANTKAGNRKKGYPRVSETQSPGADVFQSPSETKRSQRRVTLVTPNDSGYQKSVGSARDRVSTHPVSLGELQVATRGSRWGEGPSANGGPRDPLAAVLNVNDAGKTNQHLDGGKLRGAGSHGPVTYSDVMRQREERLAVERYVNTLRMRAFFDHYAPTQLDKDIELAVAEAQQTPGGLDELWQLLVQYYGPEPVSPASGMIQQLLKCVYKSDAEQIARELLLTAPPKKDLTTGSDKANQYAKFASLFTDSPSTSVEKPEPHWPAGKQVPATAQRIPLVLHGGAYALYDAAPPPSKLSFCRAVEAQLTINTGCGLDSITVEKVEDGFAMLVALEPTSSPSSSGEMGGVVISACTTPNDVAHEPNATGKYRSASLANTAGATMCSVEELAALIHDLIEDHQFPIRLIRDSYRKDLGGDPAGMTLESRLERYLIDVPPRSSARLRPRGGKDGSALLSQARASNLLTPLFAREPNPAVPMPAGGSSSEQKQQPQTQGGPRFSVSSVLSGAAALSATLEHTSGAPTERRTGEKSREQIGMSARTSQGHTRTSSSLAGFSPPSHSLRAVGSPLGSTSGGVHGERTRPRREEASSSWAAASSADSAGEVGTRPRSHIDSAVCNFVSGRASASAAPVEDPAIATERLGVVTYDVSRSPSHVTQLDTPGSSVDAVDVAEQEVVPVAQAHRAPLFDQSQSGTEWEGAIAAPAHTNLNRLQTHSPPSTHPAPWYHDMHLSARQDQRGVGERGLDEAYTIQPTYRPIAGASTSATASAAPPRHTVSKGGLSEEEKRAQRRSYRQSSTGSSSPSLHLSSPHSDPLASIMNGRRVGRF